MGRVTYRIPKNRAYRISMEVPETMGKYPIWGLMGSASPVLPTIEKMGKPIISAHIIYSENTTSSRFKHDK